MPRWLVTRTLAVLFAAQAIAQSLQGANGTGPFPPSNSSEQVGLLVDGSDAFTGPHAALPLYPLTADWQSDLPVHGLDGTIFPATTNTSGITSADIAWISCDGSDYPGYVKAVDVLQRAVSVNATAVVLYSRVDAFCNYTGDPGISTSYNRIYSMASARQSTMLEDLFRSTSGSESPRATINLEQRLNADNGTNNGQGSDTQTQQQPGGPSPSTAVAMVILYSITGVITALFLLIIVTGAIRAHRHPERYGPRAVLGRARQSRAKGLARAMLDSIPIVKFGDNEGDIPKPTDVELTSGTTKDGPADAAEGVHPRNVDTITAVHERGESASGGPQPRASRESEDGIRANTADVASPTEQAGQAQGCSICTEDFERGEDVRVLPCNHKFHPACIDPWLLNVSGTCPLCRIDLRPPTSSNENQQDMPADTSGGATGPPDIISRFSVAAEEGSGSRRHSHRLSFIFDPLNRRRMQEATPEERIEALRQYNQRQRTNDDIRRRRRSNRLSALLGRSRDQEGDPDRQRSSETPATGGADISIQPPVDSASPRVANDSHPEPLEETQTTAERPAEARGEVEAITSTASLYEDAPEQGENSTTRHE